MDLLLSASVVHKYIILGLAILNIVIALFLLIWPKAFMQLSKIMNIWVVPTDKLENALNKKVDLDEGLFKTRKFIGIISAVVGIVLLFFYTKGY